MNDGLSFVLKVFVVSTAIALAIKYGGPYLPIPATPPVVITLILLPSLLLAIALGWRSLRHQL